IPTPSYYEIPGRTQVPGNCNVTKNSPPFTYKKKPRSTEQITVTQEESNKMRFEVLLLIIGFSFSVGQDCCMPSVWSANHQASIMWKLGSSSNATSATGTIYRDGKNERAAFVDTVYSTIS